MAAVADVARSPKRSRSRPRARPGKPSARPSVHRLYRGVNVKRGHVRSLELPSRTLEECKPFSRLEGGESRSPARRLELLHVLVRVDCTSRTISLPSIRGVHLPTSVLSAGVFSFGLSGICNFAASPTSPAMRDVDDCPRMLKPGNFDAGSETRAVNGEGIVSTLDCYHTSQRFSGTIISPTLHSNACWNSSILSSGPMARNSPGECGSVWI